MATLRALRRPLRRALLGLAGGALAGWARHRPIGSPPRLLLVRPDHLGDVLLTSPAVVLLEAALPDATFTYLVGPWGAELARRGPLAAAVRPLAFPGFGRRPGGLLAPYALLWREARRLRAERYDAAVVFRPDHWWGALLALAAGIPLRLGSDTPETRPLLSHALPRVADRHAAEQALALARAAVEALGRSAPGADPRPQVRPTEAERAAAAGFLAEHQLDGRRLVAIHPGAGAPLKSWPVERWAEVADGLTGDGARVVLSGGPGEEPLVEAVRAAMATPPAAVLLGQPIGVVAAVLERCALVCGPDNGILHLAAAVGAPTLRLYGPAPPAVYGPWPPSPDQRVLLTDTLACVPCGHLEDPPCGARVLPPCLLAWSGDVVLAAARRVVDGEWSGVRDR